MLHVRDGWLYYGEARLGIKVVPEGVQFAVKETWLRPKYGREVVVPIGMLLKAWVAYKIKRHP